MFATAGGPQKVAICRDLGVDVVIDYTTEDFVEAVKDATAGRGVDIVYDPVVGDISTGPPRASRSRDGSSLSASRAGASRRCPSTNRW